MKLLLVQNITREGPGLLEELLLEYKIPFDLVNLDKGESFPDPTLYAGLVVFGGPDSMNDTTPKITRELIQIKKAIDAGMPYLGACLGMQGLVKAGGGKVIQAAVKEVGWRDPKGNFFSIDLTDEGKNDPLFTGMQNNLKIFQLHGEAVEKSDDMKILATGEFCPIQVIKVGKQGYGLQGHFELNEPMFNVWLQEDPDIRQLDRETVEKDYQEIKEEYEKIGRQMLTNFLKITKVL